MNGNSVVLDTNIVLYLLSGDKILSDILHEKKLYISFVSQLELLGFKGITTKQSVEINKSILDCVVIDINEKIKRGVIRLRKTSKLKLPDSIIVATAEYLNLPLITSDSDFSALGSSQIIIYE